MVRRTFKWKCGFIFSLLLLNVFTKSLPIEKTTTNVPVIVTDSSFEHLSVSNDIVESVKLADLKIDDDVEQETKTRHAGAVDTELTNVTLAKSNVTRNLTRQILRPGQTILNYNVEITINGDRFNGRAMIDLRVDQATREDELRFYAQDMTINSVLLGILTDANAAPADFDYDDEEGVLDIFHEGFGISYVVIIEYSAPIRNDGIGIFAADFNGQQYLGMNTYPTHARKVFPCVDELTEAVTVRFNFYNIPYPNLVANSVLEDNSQTTFRTLSTRLHLWGMVAHNFPTVMIPVNMVYLRGRSGLNQDAQAIAAIQFYFNALNEWTTKNYFEIIVDQSAELSIFAVTDTNVDWTALSSICIWEPYLYMEPIHSVAQRKVGLVKIAEAMARQWFGFVIYPENWRHEWAVAGLRLHAAYDVLKEFQADPFGIDTTMLDINTIFVTDIIQESMLRDSYASADPILLADDIFEDSRIRDIINGIVKYKSPAILWMLRLILGTDNDYIRLASQSLLNRWGLEPITSLDVISAIENEWSVEANRLINEPLEEYLEPWIENRGYPIIYVDLRQNGVILTQEHFGFTAPSSVTYNIPLTYTTSIDMDFSNIHPIEMMENTLVLPMVLDEEERDFVLFNIQGQGYYRVNYNLELWERIIECLEEPDCRNQIHPLNRATLVDDALNLARADKLDYDTAFRVVLTMEHETEYAPWKAFVRNMNFLQLRLEALVGEDEDLDPDIYLRMVRRTIGSIESELTFYPDPAIIESAMDSLTRGLVMDHACRAGYTPCIAAAIDWFYDPNSAEPVVNPDIPRDIRPAVYCTMVREGDAAVINALYERLEIEPSHWERVVILESLGCSQDESFINTLLLETIADNSPYGIEERSKILIAVAKSSYQNARLALNFARMRTIEIINRYGGLEKLEEILYVFADTSVLDLTFDLYIWVDSSQSNLGDSEDLANRLVAQANENAIWEQRFMNDVYEWIDENDAPKLVVSVTLLCVAVFIGFFNR